MITAREFKKDDKIKHIKRCFCIPLAPFCGTDSITDVRGAAAKSFRCDIISDIDHANKTISALGGELEKTAIDESDHTMINTYWINVNDSIEKYT